VVVGVMCPGLTARKVRVTPSVCPRLDRPGAVPQDQCELAVKLGEGDAHRGLEPRIGGRAEIAGEAEDRPRREILDAVPPEQEPWGKESYPEHR
jgi:hypothetical protein